MPPAVRREPWRVNPFWWHVGELRQLTFDEEPVGVELFSFSDRIEDPERGLRIASVWCTLPSAVAGGEIEVVKPFGEISLSPSPVDPQIFHEEARSSGLCVYPV